MGKEHFNEHCYLIGCVEHSEDWHELRAGGIGSSDAAAVLGMNPWKTNIDLWNEKCGNTVQDDLSDNEAVIFGSKSEEHIRAIYALKNKEQVSKPEATLISNEYPFMRYNPDGIIKRDNGLWEGKTATVRSYAKLKEWDNKIPQQYYVQCLHALAVTGANYIVLTALIYLDFSTSSEIAQLREYRINQDDVLEDIKFLIKEEVKFWKQVQNKEMPFLKIKY